LTEQMLLLIEQMQDVVRRVSQGTIWMSIRLQ
jgi:hypothetical protein